MTDEEYKNVLDHFVGLSQKYALGKIQHETLETGLKKLLGELIAERVTETARAPSSLRQRLALTGGLIAAGLALVVVLNVVPTKRVAHIAVRPIAKRPTPPTVRAYRQALAQSPAALDALLDQQAVRTDQSAAQSQPVTAFAPGNRAFLSWRGDR